MRRTLDVMTATLLVIGRALVAGGRVYGIPVYPWTLVPARDTRTGAPGGGRR